MDRGFTELHREEKLANIKLEYFLFPSILLYFFLLYVTRRIKNHNKVILLVKSNNLLNIRIFMIFTSQRFNLNHTSPRLVPIKITNKSSIISFFRLCQNEFQCQLIVPKDLIIKAIIFLILLSPISIKLVDVKLKLRKDGDMYSKALLWDLRTKLPMQFVLMNLENVLQIPNKESEGYIRFLCPVCNEMQATINPRNNFSHCFSCKKNFNNIDLLMSSGYSFSSSVEMLICQWDEFKKRSQTKAETLAWLNSNPPCNLGEKL